MRTPRLTLFLVLCTLALTLAAQVPEGYYTSADGKSAQALKSALYSIISVHTDLGYNGLWEAYKETDLRPDGKIWDMYSNTTNYDPDRGHSGNYTKEGDMFNREHSVPQSWFSEASPMKADIFHVYPTDGYVNNRRSNYPFGEVKSATYTSNGGFSKVGSCATEGYSGTVFEPADEYKGDFARTYFYMATCYEDRINGWSGGVFGHGKYPGMADWCVRMFLRWAKEDPVSQKEIDRNNAAYQLQKNRNPYIDYPGLEQYVWGEYTGNAFSSTAYVSPVEGGGNPNPNPNPNPDPDPDPDHKPNPVVDGEYVRLTSTAQLTVGAPLLIVCEEEGYAMSAQNGDIRDYVKVSPSGNIIKTDTGTSTTPYALTLGKDGSHYTLYDAVEQAYVALTGSSNKIHLLQNCDSDDARWNISIASSGTASIINVARPTYSIQFNHNSPKFCCYKSSQTSVQIYQGRVVDDSPSAVGSPQLVPLQSAPAYDLQGRMLRQRAGIRGMYINNGKKYIQ